MKGVKDRAGPHQCADAAASIVGGGLNKTAAILAAIPQALPAASYRQQSTTQAMKFSVLLPVRSASTWAWPHTISKSTSAP